MAAAAAPVQPGDWGTFEAALRDSAHRLSTAHMAALGTLEAELRTMRNENVRLRARLEEAESQPAVVSRIWSSLPPQLPGGLAERDTPSEATKLELGVSSIRPLYASKLVAASTGVLPAAPAPPAASSGAAVPAAPFPAGTAAPAQDSDWSAPGGAPVAAAAAEADSAAEACGPPPPPPPPDRAGGLPGERGAAEPPAAAPGAPGAEPGPQPHGPPPDAAAEWPPRPREQPAEAVAPSPEAVAATPASGHPYQRPQQRAARGGEPQDRQGLGDEARRAALQLALSEEEDGDEDGEDDEEEELGETLGSIPVGPDAAPMAGVHTPSARGPTPPQTPAGPPQSPAGRGAGAAVARGLQDLGRALDAALARHGWQHLEVRQLAEDQWSVAGASLRLRLDAGRPLPSSAQAVRITASDDGGRTWEELEGLVRRRRLHKVVRTSPIAMSTVEYAADIFPARGAGPASAPAAAAPALEPNHLGAASPHTMRLADLASMPMRRGASLEASVAPQHLGAQLQQPLGGSAACYVRGGAGGGAPVAAPRGHHAGHSGAYAAGGRTLLR